MPTLKVGGEVDTNCNKCELNLAHTILAMVGTTIARVKCNTCGSEHKFRGSQPMARANSFSAPRRSSEQKEAAAAAKISLGFEERLKKHDLSKAKKYSPQTAFVMNDVMDHPTFGMGMVTAVRADKVDVSFKTFEKTLLHARGAGAAAAKPAFQGATKSEGGGHADKPPSDSSSQSSES